MWSEKHTKNTLTSAASRYFYLKNPHGIHFLKLLIFPHNSSVFYLYLMDDASWFVETAIELNLCLF